MVALHSVRSSSALVAGLVVLAAVGGAGCKAECTGAQVTGWLVPWEEAVSSPDGGGIVVEFLEAWVYVECTSCEDPEAWAEGYWDPETDYIDAYKAPTRRMVEVDMETGSFDAGFLDPGTFDFRADLAGLDGLADTQYHRFRWVPDIEVCDEDPVVVLEHDLCTSCDAD